MSENGIVFCDGEYVIMQSEALFCSGFNCYKSKTLGSDIFEKINPANAWFYTLSGAEEWLKKYQIEKIERKTD